MRILFLCNHWHVTQTPCRTVGVHPELAAAGHQWVRAVSAEQAGPHDLCFDVSRDSLADVAARFPGGEPDAMVVWESGYQALPRGIEEAPFPVVACYSDWNLVMPEQAGMLDAYDHLFTDRRGARILQEMGYQNAEFWPMWGHDPDFSRVLPGVEQLWDIGMVGNLSATVQRERARWLARVAALSGKYRVRIAGGVFGEEYTRMINATKITFNRSIRGEMNMRCFEAAACGSLLFYEEENEEIRDFLEDGVHCVLYNDGNLEERLEYYLTHDAERERIIAAARERIAEFSFPRNLNRLAARLEELGLAGGGPHRRALQVSAPELWKRHARQAAGNLSLGANELAAQLLEEALQANPSDTAALNDLAVVYSLQVAKSQDPGVRRELTGKSLSLMMRALQLGPDSAFYTLNLAQMYLLTDTPATAMELVQQALALLDSQEEDPAPAECLAFPRAWNEFRVQYADLYNQTRSAPESFSAGRKCLLLHAAGTLLAALAKGQGQLLALLGRQIAVAARPDLGSGHVKLAQLLADAGDVEAALSHLEQGLTSDPFLTRSWPLYARLLLQVGHPEGFRAFLERALHVLDAVIPSHRKAFNDAASEMDEVRTELRVLAGEADPGSASPEPEAYVLTCLLQGEWERALRLIEEFGPVPGYAQHLAAAGVRLLSERRPEAALRVAERAVELDAQSALAWRTLGMARSASRKPGEAETALGRAVELDPEGMPFRLALAELLLDRGRPLEALPHTRHASAASPEDPAVQHTARRLRKALEKACGPKDPAVAELQQLLARAHGQGGSADGPTLSLCLITRNEAANLPRVIRSVQRFAAEIIVVDTGSTDDTVRIARRLGARVEQFEWVDDFAAARNASLSYATGDWILVMDADDEFPAESVGAMRGWLQRATDLDVLGYFRRYPHENVQRDSMSVQPRLFRNGRGIRFDGVIHEQVVTADGQPAQPGRVLPLTVYHHGCKEEGSGQPRRVRNIRILRSVLEREPDDARMRFYLGLTLFGAGDWEEALPHLREVAGHAPDTADFLPKAYACLGSCLLNTGQPAQAEHCVREGLRRFPLHPELWFCLGLILRGRGQLDLAVDAFEAALRGRFGASLNWHDWTCREHKPHMALCEISLARERHEEALAHLAGAEEFTGPQPRYAALRERIRTLAADPRAVLSPV